MGGLVIGVLRYFFLFFDFFERLGFESLLLFSLFLCGGNLGVFLLCFIFDDLDCWDFVWNNFLYFGGGEGGMILFCFFIWWRIGFEILFVLGFIVCFDGGGVVILKIGCWIFLIGGVDNGVINLWLLEEELFVILIFFV